MPLPLLDAVLVELMALVGWPHALCLADTAPTACAAAVVVLHGMLRRAGLELIPQEPPSGLLQLWCLVSGLVGVLDLDEASAARDYVPGTRVAAETLRHTLRPLPPARACGIRPCWEDLPVLTRWLGQVASQCSWYQLVWLEHLDPTCSALCVRIGVRLAFEGWWLDVSHQNSHLEVILDGLDSEEEEEAGPEEGSE